MKKTDFWSVVFHYIYLVRIPCIGAAILFFLPIVSNTLASRLLRNLFAMETGLQLILVMAFSAFTAVVLVSSIKTIVVLRDFQYQQSEPSNYLNLNGNDKFRLVRSILTLVLFLPACTLLFLNREPDISWIDGLIGGLFSIALWGISLVYEWRRKITFKPIINTVLFIENFFNKIYITLKNIRKKFIAWINHIRQKYQKYRKCNQLIKRLDSLMKPLDSVIKWLRQKFLFPSALIFRRMILFYSSQIFVGFLFYAIAVKWNWPQLEIKDFEVPALLYVLLIIWVMTFLIGALTYWYDKWADNSFDNSDKKSLYTFRIPLILLLIFYSASAYGISGVDHFFELQNSNLTLNYPQDFKDAIGNRLCPNDYQNNKKCQSNQSLVVVSASGGGIQASAWTAQVLGGLQEKPELGEKFTKSIGLISSTSGGSVGTMFYLDNLSDQGVLTNPSEMFNHATDDWLDSVSWGLAYPDLVRIIGFPFLIDNIVNHPQGKFIDRGYALEKDWQRSLANGDATLDSWHQKIIEGNMPIPVFNSTIVENGRRFLISPLKFLPQTMSDYLDKSQQSNNDSISAALDFRTLYNNCGGDNQEGTCTLAVTTAARLSASFPYVSPMARNFPDNLIKTKNKEGEEVDVLQNYHFADGGYFDNAGSFTAWEWLNQFLQDNANDLKINKVILIQIDAFPTSQLDEQQGKGGWFIVGIGPLNALNNVRQSTQIARNNQEIKLLQNRWQEKNIAIEQFTFSFPQFIDGKRIDQPLSWRLTQQEKTNLRDAWEKDQIIGDEVQRLKKFWDDSNYITLLWQ